MKTTIFLFLFFSSMAMASSVNINIYGKVTISPCVIENKNYLIDFKKVNIRDLKNNQNTDWINFSIKLKNCPISTQKATLTIAGTADPNNGNYFINNGTAKNIALNLVENRNKTIIKNGSKLEAIINSQTKMAEYPLAVRLIKTGDGISTGTFKSHLEFTLIYN
ncbi:MULTISPECIES: fimbrial protein [unclassified Proteus (in: enterobacteria)]|uniref:fimbrial protein n=1 Tax=unclassified Proteus (in: enterobacteria) TaxID=257482 RepID=UPI001376AB51|nr:MULTISPECIES: fimbrial protein [unclassified Proteus (in: enterobacteria)]NBM11815.1 fimbrial protein [Proteus sp. G2670]NBM31959.1 fimbrial protein [Proteus sp. G2664]